MPHLLRAVSPIGFDYVAASNPTYSVNPICLPATWLNTVTGEIFICTSAMKDRNIWIGQGGTVVDGWYIGDPLKSYDILYCPFRQNLTDKSVVGNTLTPSGNAAVNFYTRHYYEGALYLDGNGDWLTPPASVFNFGTSDFSIEFWHKGYASLTTYPYTMASSPYNSGTGFYCIVDGASTGWAGEGHIEFNGSNTLVNGPAGIKSFGLNFRDGKWRHVAISRQGVVTRLFVDGRLHASHSAAGIANYGTSGTPKIGTDAAGGTGYEKMHMEDLRITKGVCRYTENFTPSPILSFWQGTAG